MHTHQLRSLKNQRDQIVDSRNEAMRNAMIGATRRTSPEDVIARRNEEAQREREGKEYAMLERAYAERRERLDAKRRRTEERRRAGSHSTTLGGGKKSGKKKGGGRVPGGRKEENSRAEESTKRSGGGGGRYPCSTYSWAGPPSSPPSGRLPSSWGAP